MIPPWPCNAERWRFTLRFLGDDRVIGNRPPLAGECDSGWNALQAKTPATFPTGHLPASALFAGVVHDFRLLHRSLEDDNQFALGDDQNQHFLQDIAEKKEVQSDQYREGG
jgi:hypothetical protein